MVWVVGVVGVVGVVPYLQPLCLLFGSLCPCLCLHLSLQQAVHLGHEGRVFVSVRGLDLSLQGVDGHLLRGELSRSNLGRGKEGEGGGRMG